MGVYLYGLSSTGKIKAENLTGKPYGDKVHIFPFVFRHKYYGCGFDAAGKNDKASARAERNAQKASGDPLFQHLVTIGKPTVGEPVYQLENDQFMWDDCLLFPGTEIGRLTKVGRNWVVRKSEDIPSL
jgi:hypothetical protein